MTSAREMRLRIKSVQDLSQVTRALKTVSASKVKKTVAANAASLPYSLKAWQVLKNLAVQPGYSSLHPLLCRREKINRVLVIMVCSDKGLAGSYNINVLRNTLEYFDAFPQQVEYICVGKKGRDLLLRRKIRVVADFSEIPDPVSFIDISPVAKMAVDDYLTELYDAVYISFTRFHSMTHQTPEIQRLLPLEVLQDEENNSGNQHHTSAVYIYEPDQQQILDEIIPRFTGIQIFQSVLSSQASEHAARMMAMANATDNANELAGMLQMEYNKVRQQTITNDMLDIVGGAAVHGN